jgi:capsular exopolysaccharide synthesis family protein
MGRVYKALVKAGKWEGFKTADSPLASTGNRPGPLPFTGAVPHPSFQRAVCREPSQLIHVTELTVDRHLAAFWGNDRFSKERYQSLAVRVSTLALKRRLKSLLITSALDGEGKSTVALNLAWSLARPGERRVLFIDANLRNPSLARMLGISPRRSWPAMVENSADFGSTAIRLDPHHLYLLPTCQSDYLNRRNGKGADPAELITSRSAEDLFADLEEQFDLVVIDAPAISEFAETQRLAAIVDSTIMVVRAGRTSHGAVDSALKLVPKDRRLGIVLNQVAEEDQL